MEATLLYFFFPYLTKLSKSARARTFHNQYATLHTYTLQKKKVLDIRKRLDKLYERFTVDGVSASCITTLSQLNVAMTTRDLAGAGKYHLALV
jgi:hypothetical protein